nr:phage tail protein [Massilia sp. JS1662]
MASFALITEGITDQVTIETIITTHYGEEPEFRQAQPPRDATDESRQGDFAGWERVLEFCTLQEFEDLFSTNDFAIIQIDTDICEHENIQISLTDEGKDIPTEKLIENVKQFIISKIKPDLFELVRARIIFAIAVHSVECWLLPLFSDKKGSARTKNCEDHLSYAVRRSGERFSKDYDCYLKITKPLDKRKILIKCCDSNESLRIFIESLPPVAS